MSSVALVQVGHDVKHADLWLLGDVGGLCQARPWQLDSYGRPSASYILSIGSSIWTGDVLTQFKSL